MYEIQHKIKITWLTKYLLLFKKTKTTTLPNNHVTMSKSNRLAKREVECS